MYKLEIETNNTVKRIKNPRKVKVVDLIFTVLVKVMDDEGKWINIGHTFCNSDAKLAAIFIQLAINQKETFVEVDLN